MPFTSHCLYFHPWLFLDLATYGCCYSCFDSKNAIFWIIILFLSISRAAFDKCLMELNEAGIASISTFLNKDGGLDLTSNSGIVLCLKEKKFMIFSSMASKPINIRWIRICLIHNVKPCVASNYRQFFI